MLKIITVLLVALAGLLAGSTQCSTNHTEPEPFRWLIGTWKNLTYESWETWELSEDETGLIGFGYRITAESDTVITERLQIVFDQGDYYYIAEVGHNPAPVAFRIVEIAENGFKSENPQHDFPQFIQYELTNSNSLTAAIGAGERRIEFQFVRQ